MQPLDKRTEEICAEFTKVFDGAPTHVAIAPGRVNLIGEHTDYNDGFVLPVALDKDVRVVFRPRADRRVRLYAVEFDSWADFDLDEFAFDNEVFWANYTMGVAWALEEVGVNLVGNERAELDEEGDRPKRKKRCVSRLQKRPTMTLKVGNRTQELSLRGRVECVSIADCDAVQVDAREIL